MREQEQYLNTHTYTTAAEYVVFWDNCRKAELIPKLSFRIANEAGPTVACP